MPERLCPTCNDPVGDVRYCPECGERLTEEDGAEESGVPEDAAPEEDEPRAPDHEAEEGAEEPAADTPSPPAPESVGPPPPPPSEEEYAPPEAGEEGINTDDIRPRGPHQEPVIAGETPLQQAAAKDHEPGPVPADGLLRCAYCAETAYRGETICWACRRRLDDPHQVSQPEPVPEEEQAPGAEPESGAPTPYHPDPAAVPERAAPAARPQAPAGERPSPEAQSYAWWSFGLGLISVFTCGALGLLGVASIWLGAISARSDGGPLAVVGVILGVMGLLMLLAWMAALAVLMPDLLRPAVHYVLESQCLSGVFS